MEAGHSEDELEGMRAEGKARRGGAAAFLTRDQEWGKKGRRYCQVQTATINGVKKDEDIVKYRNKM